MWNNTKGEQDNLCLALINPRLCKKLYKLRRTESKKYE